MNVGQGGYVMSPTIGPAMADAIAWLLSEQWRGSRYS
jgi:hypothetical protein